MSQTRRLTALGAAMLAAIVASPHAARAESGAVIVTGNVDGKKQTSTTAAVTSALRQAKWTLVDSPFSRKDVQQIQECFQQDRPWECIEPLASKGGISQLVLVELTVEKPGTIQMIAQLASARSTISGYERGFCTPACSESLLAQSAADLTQRLLGKVAANTGSTFIEIVTDQPDAIVMMDGRQVGLADQKFPAQAGRHRIVVQLSGHRDAELEIDIVEGETKRVKVELQPLEVTTPPVIVEPPPRTWQWSLIAGGGAVLVGGSLYSYFTALDGAPPPGEPRDSKYVYNGKALIVAGIGGAAAVAGLIWMLRTPDPESAPMVSLTRDGVHAGWSFSF